MECRVCSIDCVAVWCDDCWSVRKAHVLECEAKRVPKVSKTNDCLKGVLGSGEIGCLTKAGDCMIEQVAAPSFRPGGGELWVIRRRVMPWEIKGS
jgi:hypothetical protein